MGQINVLKKLWRKSNFQLKGECYITTKLSDRRVIMVKLIYNQNLAIEIRSRNLSKNTNNRRKQQGIFRRACNNSTRERLFSFLTTESGWLIFRSTNCHSNFSFASTNSRFTTSVLVLLKTKWASSKARQLLEKWGEHFHMVFWSGVQTKVVQNGRNYAGRLPSKEKWLGKVGRIRYCKSLEIWVFFGFELSSDFWITNTFYKIMYITYRCQWTNITNIGF